MKTLILYYSSHHGNTKKLVDAIVAQGNVTAVDVSAATVTDCSDYDMTSSYYFITYLYQT